MPNPKSDIFKEILASDGIHSWTGYGAAAWPGMIPDDPSWCWEQLLTSPYVAQAIFDDVFEKDSMVSSCLDTRRDGVLSKPRVVLATGDKAQDKRLAEWADETLTEYFDAAEAGDGYFGFENFLYEALDAVGRGVSIGEILWQDSPDRIAIRDVRFKPPTLFGFGSEGLAAYTLASYIYPQTGPLRLRQGVALGDAGADGKLPQNKFFVHTYRPRYSNRWGSPLGRRIYWPSWFKRNSVRQWLRYLEKGTGTIVSRYNDGSGEGEQDKALESAQAVAEESAVAIPKKFLMEVMEHVRAIGSSHKEMVDDFCNNEIARAVLGQTLTSRGSEGGGSRALGDVHNAVRQEKVEADAKSLMLAVNTQIIFPLTYLNYGPTVRKPPVWTIQCEPAADQTVLAEWINKLWDMNFPLSKNWIYNAFQAPKPENEGDTLVKAQSAPTGGGLDDNEDSADFAEKKTSKLRKPSDLKTARFQRLRPSTTEY
jgi:phage gp29-like protein